MKRNNLLDLFRAILTVFVLLYHLGLCKAGYIAVCGFFTISGYLLANSLDDIDFNIKEYYKKRLRSLYLPLLVVVFTTIFVFNYVIYLPWTSIKQETFSVLLAYNNFFQIKAESNYFIRSDASPFTHMWYIAILIQIEFIVPLIVSLKNKLNQKTNKYILVAITVLSIFCFVLIDKKYGMAISYYNTFARIFSFLIGYTIYYFDYMCFNKKLSLFIMLAVVALFFVGDFAENNYVVLMIAVSILSGLFIMLSKYIEFKEIKIVKFICKISYFIYLVQYPIIYIIDSLTDYKDVLRIIIEFVLIVLFSIVFSYGLNPKDKKYHKTIYTLILVISFVGFCSFISGPNYEKQMEELEKQLETNQEILSEKQDEYFDKIKDKQKLALDDVAQIDEALENIDETVKNSSVLLIGDSIMLGGSFHLDEYFNNYYCDAKGSRNGYLAYETLSDLLDRGIDSDYIVIHLGTNSGLELEEVESIASLLDEQKVLWLTVTNGWRKSENPMLEEYCATHKNNYLVDWYNYSLGHKEYFGADGLHLSDNGRHVYDQFIFDNLKEVITEDLSNKKEKLISTYNNENNNTISFYGNDILINLYNKLDKSYLYYTDSAYDFDTLYKTIKEHKENLILSKTVFVVIDKNISISDENIYELKELLKESDAHIFAYNQNANNLQDILDNSCYKKDGIHLNSKGNKTLLKEIKKYIGE